MIAFHLLWFLVPLALKALIVGLQHSVRRKKISKISLKERKGILKGTKSESSLISAEEQGINGSLTFVIDIFVLQRVSTSI